MNIGEIRQEVMNIFSTNYMFSATAPKMNYCFINLGYQNLFTPTFGTIGSYPNNIYTETNIFGQKVNRTNLTNPTQNITKTTSKTINNTRKTQKQDLRNDFVKTSKKYLGFNESDGSSKMISKSGEWCADFIKYVINESYRDKGLTPPTSDLRIEPGMPHLRVENIKQWGIKHDTYLPIAGKSNKAETIASKVKPGDVFILRENASHTGFVSKVYKDGSFDSIEGNRDDKVTTHHYQANDPTLSGFVQVRS